MKSAFDKSAKFASVFMATLLFIGFSAALNESRSSVSLDDAAAGSNSKYVVELGVNNKGVLLADNGLSAVNLTFSYDGGFDGDTSSITENDVTLIRDDGDTGNADFTSTGSTNLTVKSTNSGQDLDIYLDSTEGFDDADIDSGDAIRVNVSSVENPTVKQTYNLKVRAIGGGSNTDIVYPSYNIDAALPDKAVWVDQPTDTESDTSIEDSDGSGLLVEIRDKYGNKDSDYGGPVTVSIDNDPTGKASLSGTRSGMTSGDVLFDDLSIETAASGYKLNVGNGGINNDTSDSFDILAGDAYEISLNSAPNFTQIAGVPIYSPSEGPIKVKAVDEFGNPVQGAKVYVSEYLGTTDIFDSGSTTRTTGTGGVAEFDDLVISDAGDYRLGFSINASDDNSETSFGLPTPTLDVVLGPRVTVDAGDLPNSDLEGDYDVGKWFQFSPDSDLSTAKYEYRSDGGTFNTIGSGSSATFDTTTVIDGEYVFRANVSDGEGNKDSVKTGSLEIDNKQPSASTNSPPSNAKGTQDVTAWFKSSGDVDNETYKYKASGDSSFTEISSSNETSFNTTKTLSDGSVDFRLVADDDEGNTDSATATVTVDNKAPIVQGLNLSLTDNDQPTVKVNIKELTTSLSSNTYIVVQPVGLEGPPSIDGISITSNDNIILDFEEIDSVTDLPDGKVDVSIDAVDEAGNRAGFVKKSFMVDTVNPNIESAETMDLDEDGEIDHYNVTFNESVDDSSFDSANWNSVGGRDIQEVNQTVAFGNEIDDDQLFIRFDESGSTDTGKTPELTTSDNPSLSDLAGNSLASIGSDTLEEEDGANPVIELDKGVNLVSFPITDNSELPVSYVLNENKTNRVWKFNPVSDTWKVWTPEKAKDSGFSFSFQDIIDSWIGWDPGSDSGFSFTVEAGQGYIVNASTSYKVTPEIDDYSGKLPTPSYRLGAGWNLIGHFKESPENVTDATGSAKSSGALGQIGDMSVINEINENIGMGVQEYEKIGSGSKFHPGEAYWVRTDSVIPGGYPIEYLPN